VIGFGRLLAVILVWAGVFHVLRSYGALWLPREVARELTLDTFMGAVHVLTGSFALVVSWLVLRHPREELGLLLPSSRAVGVTIGLTPAVFVLGTATAFLVARPTLIQEILQGGVEAAQRNTGELGRQLVQASPVAVLVWGAVLSPLSEELFFRGALWSLVAAAVSLAAERSPLDAAPPSLPVELINEGTAVRVWRAVRGWLTSGGVATLTVGALFAVMHRDMPGGLGIVRFVSALVLGLACGLARQHGQSVVPAILLHVLWNTLSVAAVRRWIVTETFPTKYGAPTLVAAVAVVTTAAVVAGWLGGRAGGKNLAAQRTS
jgi:membrane protease YdiL (CAAX protease family)